MLNSEVILSNEYTTHSKSVQFYQYRYPFYIRGLLEKYPTVFFYANT